MIENGKELVKEHWDWLGPLLEHVYKDAMEHGFKHGMESVSPPSPPNGPEAEVRRLRTIIELAQEAVEKGWNPRWELECAENPPSPPAGLPGHSLREHDMEYYQSFDIRAQNALKTLKTLRKEDLLTHEQVFGNPPAEVPDLGPGDPAKGVVFLPPKPRPRAAPNSFVDCKNIEDATKYIKERLSHRPPAEVPEVEQLIASLKERDASIVYLQKMHRELGEWCDKKLAAVKQNQAEVCEACRKVSEVPEVGDPQFAVPGAGYNLPDDVSQADVERLWENKKEDGDKRWKWVGEGFGGIRPDSKAVKFDVVRKDEAEKKMDEVYRLLTQTSWQWKSKYEALKATRTAMPEGKFLTLEQRKHMTDTLFADAETLTTRVACPKFPKAIGKKPANSCAGCTTECKAKGVLKDG